MCAHWTNNKQAADHVKNLLEQAGAPLELRVASICENFCDETTVSENVHLDAEKLVYEPFNSEEGYREVDQRVQFYEEFEVNDNTGIQLIVDIPIECKFRKDIEYFAFPDTNSKFHEGFPIYGDLSGSIYFSSLRESYHNLGRLGTSIISSIEIKSSQTPKQIHKENLIYKAAGALYDYVLFDAQQDMSNSDSKAQKILSDLKLLDKFKRYLNENRYAWWSVIRSWLSSIDPSIVNQVNQKYFVGSCIYFEIKAQLPIVCVNGSIHRVDWDPTSGIQGFVPLKYCLASIRKQGWPGPLRFKLVRRTPELPVVVTNPDSLKATLELAFNWYESIRLKLSSANPDVISRWLTEHILFNQIVSHYIKDEQDVRYRSDLSSDRWL